MSKKKKDFVKLGEMVEKIREKGQTFKEGAEAFGVPVQYLYDYNHWAKQEARKKTEEGPEKPESVERGEGGGRNAATEKVGKPGVPEEIQELILAYRKALMDRGAS